MQTTSALFTQRADAQMRPIGYALAISFDRVLNPSAGFFTVGVSEVGGHDFIAGTTDVVQIWDQYQYIDYTNRVVTMDWSQTYDPVYQVQSALGDMVLDNHDSYLSADDFDFPYRPLRIDAGFGNVLTGDVELLPQFVGVTSAAPSIDYTAKTASYTMLDFLSTLYNRPLNEVVFMTNVTTDVVLGALLQLVGLSPTQYDLDVGYNTIPVAYFDPTTTFGTAAKQLMQAEMGRLFMTETGVVTFWNRQRDAGNEPVWTFDAHNIIDYTTNDQTNLINTVQITSNQLVVQPNQKYWEQTDPSEVLASSTLQIPVKFSDPCQTVDTPVYAASVPTTPTTSYYNANTASDGSGSTVSSGISVSVTPYATNCLINFTNSNGFPVYLTDIVLFTTPARSADTLLITEQNATSVDQYDEQLMTIENDFFGDEDSMNSYAQIMLMNFASFGQIQTLTVKGNPALQVFDVIWVNYRDHTYIAESGDTLTSIAAAYDLLLTTLEGLNPTITSTTASLTDGKEVYLGIFPEIYQIVGKQSSLASPQFSQILTLIPFQPVSYFTVGVSSVGGSALISP